MTSTPGFYCLLIHLAETSMLKAGHRPPELFPAGYYVYCGSALAGLEGRLARHFRTGKRPHWHVDFLLAKASVVEAWGGATSNRMECDCARALLNLPSARLIHRSFGASDCRCPGHLIWLPYQPGLNEALGALVKKRPGAFMCRAIVLTDGRVRLEELYD